MKSTVRNFRNTVIAVLTLSAFVFANTVAANNTKPGSTIELKYIGKAEDGPVFQLNLVNEQEEEFSITFRDENGNVLYSEKVKGTNITKRFRLSNEQLADDTVKVEVKNKKGSILEQYTINRQVKVVDEASVTKLDK